MSGPHVEELIRKSKILAEAVNSDVCDHGGLVTNRTIKLSGEIHTLCQRAEKEVKND